MTSFRVIEYGHVGRGYRPRHGQADAHGPGDDADADVPPPVRDPAVGPGAASQAAGHQSGHHQHGDGGNKLEHVDADLQKTVHAQRQSEKGTHE